MEKTLYTGISRMARFYKLNQRVFLFLIVLCALTLVIFPASADYGPDYGIAQKNGTLDQSGLYTDINGPYYYQVTNISFGATLMDHTRLWWNGTRRLIPTKIEIPDLVMYCQDGTCDAPDEGTRTAVVNYSTGGGSPQNVTTISWSATYVGEVLSPIPAGPAKYVDLVGTVTWADDAWLNAQTGDQVFYAKVISDSITDYTWGTLYLAGVGDGYKNITMIVDKTGIALQAGWNVNEQVMCTGTRDFYVSGTVNWVQDWGVTNDPVTADKTVMVLRNSAAGYSGWSALRVYDVLGNLTWSEPITNQNTSEFFAATTGIFKLYSEQTGTETTIFDDAYYIPGSSSGPSMHGYTMDGYTGAILPAVFVQATHGTTVATTTSDGFGNYTILNLENGVLTLVDAAKVSYIFNPFTFTPWGNLTFNINLTLIPTTIPGVHNSAIYGIVYTSWSHNPIAGATVTIVNGTWSDTYTTSASGFYIFNDLAGGETYHIAATAAGHTPSGVYDVLTVGGSAVEQDVGLTVVYVLTVFARDGDTSDLILGTPVYIQLSDTQTANTTTGSAVFNVDAGLITITATASGYTTGQTQASVSGDTTAIVLLYNSTAPSGAGIRYPPHHVKFFVRDAFGNPIVGALVVANFVESTSPLDWFYNVLGMSTSVKPQTTTMQGTTGADGAIDFMMIESVKYNVDITKSGVISTSMEVYPKDDTYTVWSTAMGLPNLYEHGYNPLEVIGLAADNNEYSPTQAWVNITFTDTLFNTTRAEVWINRTGLSNGTEILVDSYIDTSGGNFTHSFLISDYRGHSYMLRVNATHNILGTVYRSGGFSFDSGPVDIPPIPEDWHLGVAMIALVFTGMIVPLSSTGVGGLAWCFEGWIWFGMRWLRDLGPSWAVMTAFALSTMLAFGYIFMQKKRTG